MNNHEIHREVTVYHLINYGKIKYPLFCILLSFACLSLIGCAGWFNVKDLKADSLDEANGFSSAILLHVKLLTKFEPKSGFDPPNNSSVYFTGVNDKTGSSLDWLDNERMINKVRTDTGFIYESVFVGQVRPNKNDTLWSLSFHYSGSSSPFIINKGFALKPGELLYLGTIEIFEDCTVKPNWKPAPASLNTPPNTLIKDVPTKFSFNSFGTDIQLFQTKYPRLYQKFINNIDTVSWK